MSINAPRHSQLGSMTSHGVAPTTISGGSASTNGSESATPHARPRRITNPVLVVHSLPPQQFALIWCTMLAARVACALFLLGLSRIYKGLMIDCMSYYATLLSPNASNLYPTISWICLILSAAHWYQIADTLLVSLRARRLLFNNHRIMKVAAPEVAKVRRPSRDSRWTVHRIYTNFFSRQGFFGAESAFFEAQFLSRELVEMASQTSQVISGSKLIGRPWINHTLVAVLFINSWSTPAIQHFTRQHAALERVLCLTADFVLDAIMNITLPLILVIPYYYKYDAVNCTFDSNILYSDVGIINFVMESRMVFVRGLTDLLLKLIPHVSMYMCLRSMQSLLRPAQKSVDADQDDISNLPTPPPSNKIDTPTSTGNTRSPRCSSIASIMPTEPTGAVRQKRRRSAFMTGVDRYADIARSLTLRIHHMQSRRLQGHKATFVHSMFIAWGLLVLGMHVKTAIRANLATQNSPPGCLQPLRPWSATLPACSAFRYSCANDNATSPVEETLEGIDASSLASLVLSDCPDLHMPSAIRSFSELMEFEIWNSHITSWEADAAFKSDTHPNLIYCGIIQSTMDELPFGLRVKLPSALQDIEISHCNITNLPDDLDSLWPHVDTLYIEYCNLSEFPEVLTRMTIDDLSLVGNALTVIPAAMIARDTFSLALSKNPISAIAGDADADAGLVEFLALENTEIKELPSWLVSELEDIERFVFMYGTPYCESRPIDPNNTVTCADTNLRSSGRYPLDLVIELRQNDG